MTDTMQAAAPITRPMPDTIRLERMLDAPIETVWRYLTEANLRREWFMGGTDAVPGGEFELLKDVGLDAPLPHLNTGFGIGARLASGHSVRLDDPLAVGRFAAEEVEQWRDAGIYYLVPCLSNERMNAVFAS